MTLSELQLKNILGMYGRVFSRVVFIKGGYRNTSHIVELTSGNFCNLIVYKNEQGIKERIRRINGLSTHLHKKGLPVRVPLDERIVTMKGGHATRYASLYSFESGETIPWEAYTKKHIKLLGYVLAQFHESALDFDGHLPTVQDEYRAVAERMKRYFSEEKALEALKEKLTVTLSAEFRTSLEFIEHTKSLSQKQPLHMDFVRGNVLFQSTTPDDTLVVDGIALSGILDLEKAAVGHPLFDIARTLAFLLVDCDKPADKVYKYFLDSGYRKRGGQHLQPVVLDGDDVLEKLVTFFLLHDFYKFLRQNPYESLPDNHHFVRTRNILLERKVLQLS